MEIERALNQGVERIRSGRLNKEEQVKLAGFNLSFVPWTGMIPILRKSYLNTRCPMAQSIMLYVQRPTALLFSLKPSGSTMLIEKESNRFSAMLQTRASPVPHIDRW